MLLYWKHRVSILNDSFPPPAIDKTFSLMPLIRGLQIFLKVIPVKIYNILNFCNFWKLTLLSLIIVLSTAKSNMNFLYKKYCFFSL